MERELLRLRHETSKELEELELEMRERQMRRENERDKLKLNLKRGKEINHRTKDIFEWSKPPRIPASVTAPLPRKKSQKWWSE